MSEKRFSETRECGHCGNSAPMEIVKVYSQVKTCYDSDSDFPWDEGNIYEMLLCPACQGVLLRCFFWHEAMMEPSDVKYIYLYPISNDSPQGLPDTIKKAYDAANKVRTIDTNAYAVLIGRLLELICVDRNASGKFLSDRLTDLANKGEIPKKLIGVSSSLRTLRNIGAHATLGELTTGEIPILDNLCRAILEYVYSAPFLVEEAEKRVSELKSSSSNVKKNK